jgi:hypothetical protein
MLSRWIVEVNLFAAHHVGQCQRGENFGDRANLEDRLSIDRARIAICKIAMGDDPAAAGFGDTHHNSDRLLLLINASHEDLADFVVASHGIHAVLLIGA